MSTLSEIIKSLSSTREGVLPSLQTFPPLDVEQIATELRLDMAGNTDGKHNQPPTDSIQESVTEGRIRTEIERRGRKALDEYRSQLDLYEGRIRRALNVAQLRPSVEAAGQNALADFKVQATDDLDHLHDARRQVEGTEREFEAFREVNHLVRLPKVSSKSERGVKWLVLGIIICFESILNGMFFQKGAEFGLIGGVIQALVLSALNVGIGYSFARYGLPQCMKPPRSYGAFFTVLYLALAVLLNLFIGHYRDLFVQSAGQVPAADLLQRLFSKPLGFVEAQSLILFLFGIGLNFASMIDSASMEDLFPGYGEVGRRRLNAQSDYSSRKAFCYEGLKTRRDQGVAAMSMVIDEVRSSEYDKQIALQGRKRLHDYYRAYLVHLSESLSRLEQRYRQANIESRSSPPPPRFEASPAPLAILADPQPLHTLDIPGSDIEHIIQRMEYYIRVINEEYEKAAAKYHTISDLTEEAETPPPVHA